MGMLVFRRQDRLLVASICVAVAAVGLLPLAAQSVTGTVANPGFEEGGIGGPPPGWRANAPGVPADGPQPYVALIDADDPREGRASVRLDHVGAAGAPGQYGALGSAVDASLYRGRRVRVTASVRIDPGTAGPVALWLRTDRSHGRPSV